jgi:hypothetical protein
MPSHGIKAMRNPVATPTKITASAQRQPNGNDIHAQYRSHLFLDGALLCKPLGTSAINFFYFAHENSGEASLPRRWESSKMKTRHSLSLPLRNLQSRNDSIAPR